MFLKNVLEMIILFRRWHFFLCSFSSVPLPLLLLFLSPLPPLIFPLPMLIFLSTYCAPHPLFHSWFKRKLSNHNRPVTLLFTATRKQTFKTLELLHSENQPTVLRKTQISVLEVLEVRAAPAWLQTARPPPAVI